MSYEARRALAEIDLFAGLSPSELSDLLERGTTLTTPPGGTLTEQGSTQTGLQVLLDGTATVYVNGTERATLNPGDYFGEISLIDGSPRSATIIAGPDGLRTFALSALAFAPVIDTNPSVAKSLLKGLCARVRSMESPTSARD